MINRIAKLILLASKKNIFLAKNDRYTKLAKKDYNENEIKSYIFEIIKDQRTLTQILPTYNDFLRINKLSVKNFAKKILSYCNKNKRRILGNITDNIIQKYFPNISLEEQFDIYNTISDYISKNFSSIMTSIIELHYTRIETIVQKITQSRSRLAPSEIQSILEEIINDNIDILKIKPDDCDINNANDLNINNFSKNIRLIFSASQKLRDNIISLFTKYDESFTIQYTDDIYNIYQQYAEFILQLILSKSYPDKASKQYFINKLKNKRSNIIDKVKKAYNNVKQWIKKDYPHLELLDLYDNYITIGYIPGAAQMQMLIIDDKGSIRIPGFKDYSKMKEGIYKCIASITINTELIDLNDSALLKLIYHELVHAIKKQGDETLELTTLRYKNKEPLLNPTEYQNSAHNDEIWDQGADSISKHTHLDLDFSYAGDKEYTPFYENDNISHKLRDLSHSCNQLNKPHEATLICYNCGWFKVYEVWNKDCDRARDNNFICPECHQQTVKLISPGSGEKELIDDAFSQWQAKSVEIKKNLEPSKQRLQYRQDREDEISRLKNKKRKKV